MLLRVPILMPLWLPMLMPLWRADVDAVIDANVGALVRVDIDDVMYSHCIIVLVVLSCPCVYVQVLIPTLVFLLVHHKRGISKTTKHG
jgi:hypothetical protein